MFPLKTSLNLFLKCLIGSLVFASLFIGWGNSPTAGRNYECLSIALRCDGPEYEGTYYTGYYPSTDWVIWIEDENGNFIKTINVSKGIVKIGKYGASTHHVPTWETSGNIKIEGTVADDSLAYVPTEFDGLTAASTNLTYLADTTIIATWDLTDADGNDVPDGTYYFCTETANLIKNGTSPEFVVPTIVSETTKGKVVTSSGKVTSALATEHIINFSAVLQ